MVGTLDEQKLFARLADTFHIAPSALRYWDKMGLVHFERSPENNYRYPTMQTMLELCDVLLNRSLSIPIKAMQKIPQMNAAELEALLQENETKLTQQAKDIQESIERIHVKQQMLEKFKTLKKQQGFVIESRCFPAIKPFSFQNERDIQIFVHETYQSAILVCPGAEHQYGLFTEVGTPPLLREKDTQAHPYIKGLLWVPSDDTPGSNYQDFSAEAIRLGSKPGPVFGRYLINVCEGMRYDYYEAWMRLENQ